MVVMMVMMMVVMHRRGKHGAGEDQHQQGTSKKLFHGKNSSMNFALRLRRDPRPGRAAPRPQAAHATSRQA